ncbi:MAG: DUF2784 family protein [Bacteroidetes bacterium]|nr:MAG: DUF2784 family protein [Bacteroidota bacterium]REK34552.1 MAG: DUF2784 family protein [Bacteroidota bacterium]REK51811.1 MAG: DUF2784 family protein [Bacteroidota bacterium]
MLKTLDIFFFVFHTGLILFNITGYFFKKFRKWNLLTLILTGLSWFVLGIWYGIGYCPCTDWHWQVRRELGYTEFYNSYIQFLVVKLTGIQISPQITDLVVVLVFVFSLVLSIAWNFRDFKKKNRIV